MPASIPKPVGWLLAEITQRGVGHEPVVPAVVTAVDIDDEQVLEQLAKHRDAAVVVPRLYLQITGSLPSASALFVIDEHCERARQHSGSPWVPSKPAAWASQAGLSAAEWLQAAAQLRQQGLLLERERFDERCCKLVLELALDADVLAAELGALRQGLKLQANAQQQCRSWR